VAFLAGFERLGDGVGKWRKMFSLHRPRFPAISARAAAAPKVPFLLCVRPFFSPQSMGQSLCGCILGSNSPLRVYESCRIPFRIWQIFELLTCACQQEMDIE
jgi:hypothetical protein